MTVPRGTEPSAGSFSGRLPLIRDRAKLHRPPEAPTTTFAHIEEAERVDHKEYRAMKRQLFFHSCCIIFLIVCNGGGPLAVAATATADVRAAAGRPLSTLGDSGDSFLQPADSSHRLRRTASATRKTTTQQEESPEVAARAAAADNDDESGPVYHVPTFDLAELRNPSSSSSYLRHVLGDTGLLSISTSSSSTTTADAIRQVRRRAMKTVCSCLREAGSTDGTTRTVSRSGMLRDGTIRTTLATATIGATPIPLEPMNYCPDDQAVAALEALRDIVHGIAQEFITALDGLLWNDDVDVDGNDTNSNTTATKNRTPPPPLLHTTRGRSYTTIQDIVRASHNLEHFHLYEKKKKSDDGDDCQDDGNDHDETILPIHTDAGLFLVFVPGLDCDATTIDDDNDNTSSSSLWVQRRNGKVQRAVFAPDTFGVLMGTGAEHWLQNMKTLPLRATRHAVSMRCQSRRAWYGMSTYTFCFVVWMNYAPTSSIGSDYQDISPLFVVSVSRSCSLQCTWCRPTLFCKIYPNAPLPIYAGLWRPMLRIGNIILARTKTMKENPLPRLVVDRTAFLVTIFRRRRYCRAWRNAGGCKWSMTLVRVTT
jgi:hypothetical protein